MMKGFICDDDDDEQVVLSLSSSSEDGGADEVASLKRSQREAPLLGARARTKVQRLDPSHRADDWDDDDDQEEEEGDGSDDLEAEEEENDGGEDGQQDDRNALKQAELEYQAQEFGAFLSAVTRKRARPLTSWNDLMRSCGWFRRFIMEPLDAVRAGLGNTNCKQSVAQGHWDWILSEALAGRKPSLHRLLDGERKSVCIYCSMTKPCTYSLVGRGTLGAYCAKLAEAWVNWCLVFAALLKPGRERDAPTDVRALLLAKGAVLQAHEDKAAARGRR